MDQIKDSIADQHFRRRRTQQTKIRCFLGCFGGGGASEEDEKLPQRKFKSINQSRSWFSCLKLRSKKSPKRTVPVESQSATDEKKFNHEKGRCVLGRSKSKSNKMMSAYDELPAKGDDEILNQPPVTGRSKPKSNKMISACDELPAKGDDEILKQTPVAGEVQHGKANKKTRSGGKGIFLRNSKSMNHIELLEPIIKENHTCKQGATRSSLRKSKSAKTTTTTTLINQPAGGGGGDSQLIRPNTTELSLSLSQSQSQSDVAEQQQEITTGHRGENGVDDENRVVKKTDEKNKGGGGSNIDRVVGISIIVMVLLIMAVWGKLCAILCSSAWLYFYPLLLRPNNNNNINIKNGRTQLNVVGQSQTKESNKSLQLVHGNSQLQKKKVVFEGFLQRDHQIL